MSSCILFVEPLKLQSEETNRGQGCQHMGNISPIHIMSHGTVHAQRLQTHCQWWPLGMQTYCCAAFADSQSVFHS